MTGTWDPNPAVSNVIRLCYPFVYIEDGYVVPTIDPSLPSFPPFFSMAYAHSILPTLRTRKCKTKLKRISIPSVNMDGYYSSLLVERMKSTFSHSVTLQESCEDHIDTVSTKSTYGGFFQESVSYYSRWSYHFLYLFKAHIYTLRYVDYYAS